jgi:methylenetetrahydrofolate reductase (NADPH)
VKRTAASGASPAGDEKEIGRFERKYGDQAQCKRRALASQVGGHRACREVLFLLLFKQRPPARYAEYTHWIYNVAYGLEVLFFWGVSKLRVFREAVQAKQFSLSAELTLTRESTADDVRRQAGLLGQYVDGIQVTDNPFAWVQMSALSASAILLGEGVDPVPILTCRDRNRIALESDLLGLRALGVTSLILTRGHRVPKRHAVQASTVFDITGRELIALASSISEPDHENPGEPFFIGTAARVFKPGADWRAESLKARAAAGARFVQTQLCFNTDFLRRYMSRFIEERLTWNYSVMASLSPLPSAVTADWMKKNIKDARIPASLIRRMESAKNEEREGIRICAELMQEISEIPGISGIHLMTTGSMESIPAAIEASGLRNPH